MSDCSDRYLLERVKRLVSKSHSLTAELLLHLGEVDARKLFLDEACSSMFKYCTDILFLSEHATYKRIAAARATRRFPALYDFVASGQVHLAGPGKLALLAERLMTTDLRELLQEAERSPWRAAVASFRQTMP